LKLARCADAVCTTVATRAVDSVGDVGQYSSLALIAGKPVIAYFDAANALKLASCTSVDCATGISTRTVQAAAGKYLSMTLDIDNNPVIAYLATPGTLRVAHCDALACTAPLVNTLQTALTGAIDTSIAMDPTTDFPVVSYIDSSDPAGRFMAVAHCDDAVCTTSVLATPDRFIDLP